MADKLLAYDDLSYAQKKYVQFCVAEHSDEIPLLRACPPTGELGRIATASVAERGNSIVREPVVLD
eukprot:COSAG02_NODE_6443_length_3565_cov_9.490626_3_plen_65_part_01